MKNLLPVKTNCGGLTSASCPPSSLFLPLDRTEGENITSQPSPFFPGSSHTKTDIKYTFHNTQVFFVLVPNYTKIILVQQWNKHLLHSMLCRICPKYVMVEPATELMVGFSRFSELSQENLLLQRSCGLGLLCCWKCLVDCTCPWKYHSSLLSPSPFLSL